MQHGVNTLAAATAKTITFTKPSKHIELSNGCGAVIYGKVNYPDSGGTEVASTSFEFQIPSAGSISFDFPVEADNVRLITSGSGNIGIFAW